MLHEYAVEPELVATWCDRASGRYFLDKFGLGSPRIMSRYPRKRWKRLVWEAWKANSHDDSERKRMEELIQRLSEDMVTRRDAVWNPDGTWLEQRPFARVSRTVVRMLSTSASVHDSAGPLPNPSRRSPSSRR